MSDCSDPPGLEAADSCAVLLEVRGLRRTGEVLDDHTQELIAGGQDRGLPSSVYWSGWIAEQLEGSVETVAGTVEPLKGVAKGVGRVSGRLSRQS